MDALPIQEENDVPYRSTIDGVMHACGHDGHMAMMMIAAKILKNHQNDLRGTVKFVFQPSEEKLPGGAKGMIRQGVLENPKPDMAFALHLLTDNPVGTLGVKAGPILAFTDDFNLTVLGKSGHAALPEETVDAIEISDHIRNAWKTILTREISPMEPVVIHVGAVHGGTADNVVADRVEIRGTVRAFNPRLRQFIAERMKTTAKYIAKAMRAKAVLKYKEGYPAVINDKVAVDFVSKVAGNIGGLKVVEERTGYGRRRFRLFFGKDSGMLCLARGFQ